ncbi:hypothetical protein G6O69_34295 [Pseudenhygromyxa sp. WMMC2535]|uniref:hypothetical protein n=1 Tax=Pseudenhygromyxa sp. WMMC2535 TaxID=2712867 RepID=UPI00159548CE|nr:hypothetical protein [Pseudenhygromyxa sp. WMMC2535]NVB42943.1 hypothetical protein [Pseudenhygromyxa sp. WMMC2535]
MSSSRNVAGMLTLVVATLGSGCGGHILDKESGFGSGEDEIGDFGGTDAESESSASGDADAGTEGGTDAESSSEGAEMGTDAESSSEGAEVGTDAESSSEGAEMGTDAESSSEGAEIGEETESSDEDTDAGTTDSGGGESCKPESDENPCFDCVKSACCAEIVDCLANEACACAYACAESGVHPLTCQDLCDAHNDPADTLLFCGEDNCLLICID